MSERSKRELQPISTRDKLRGAGIVMILGLVVFLSTENNDEPVKPVTKAKLICPPTPQELANDRTLQERISPNVRFVIRNNGGELDSGTRTNSVTASIVTHDESAPADMPNPQVETEIIHDFGQHQFTDPAGNQYIVDVAKPPAQALAIDPQAADILICR